VMGVGGNGPLKMHGDVTAWRVVDRARRRGTRALVDRSVGARPGGRRRGCVAMGCPDRQPSGSGVGRTRSPGRLISAAYLEVGEFPHVVRPVTNSLGGGPNHFR
jgi:hypothetical protein